jgi:putative phosphoesterase
MSDTILASKAAQPEGTQMLIGVLADTHIPDRVNDLHPDVLPAFAAVGVQQIFHAGDISTDRVLARLREVAPVTAVRGNRDIFTKDLNRIEQFEFAGVQVALMHGHGGLFPYLRDKLLFYRDGYQLNRYLDLVVDAAGAAQVVVFGHTHHAVIHQHRGKLVFNPGSASFGPFRGELPSIGLLRISGGEAKPEIIQLRGWKISDRQWMKG